MNNPRHFAAAAYCYEHMLPPDPDEPTARYDGHDDIQESIDAELDGDECDRAASAFFADRLREPEF